VAKRGGDTALNLWQPGFAAFIGDGECNVESVVVKLQNNLHFWNTMLIAELHRSVTVWKVSRFFWVGCPFVWVFEIEMREAILDQDFHHPT
jgi:hypothetical protein